MSGDRSDGASRRRVRPRQTLVDAGAAALALALVVGTGVAVDAAPRPVAVAAGAAATLIAEWVALADGERRERLRTTWERPSVRVGSAVLAAVVVAVGVQVAPEPALSLAGGALGAYLVLVAAVLTARAAD